jgi:hypothetical protein
MSAFLVLKLVIFYSDDEKIIELLLVLEPVLFGMSAFKSSEETPPLTQIS